MVFCVYSIIVTVDRLKVAVIIAVYTDFKICDFLVSVYRKIIGLAFSIYCLGISERFCNS